MCWKLLLGVGRKGQGVVVEWRLGGRRRGGRGREGGREGGEGNKGAGDWVSTTGEEQELDVSPQEAREFRACAARLNYLGQNSPDAQFPREGSVFGDVEADDGELEEVEEGRPFFWLGESASCGIPSGSLWRSRPS